MKKTRFILLALVAAMVLMGAGYAAWSQTFTITSAVSTGELCVVVSEADEKDGIITSVKVDTNGDGSYDDEGGFVVVAPDEAAANYLPDGYPSATFHNYNNNISELTYAIPTIYPGVQVASEVKFTNTGTIKTQTFVNTAQGICNIANQTLFDALKITVNGTDISGTGGDKLSALANAIATAVGELEPGDNNSKTITIIQELPIGEPGDNTTENQTGDTWRVGFVFEQYNAPTE
jgi:hypothetical protein